MTSAVSSIRISKERIGAITQKYTTHVKMAEKRLLATLHSRERGRQNPPPAALLDANTK